MHDFFNLKSAEEVLAQYTGFAPLAEETIPLPDARGRVLARDLLSPEPLPPFSRSTVDGFAVRARDTFGCSESEPALLTVIGEVPMGSSGQDFALRAGEAVRIWTGGELPLKADGVVMVEQTRPFDAATIAVYRPVAPTENVIAAGEDYAQGALVLPCGRCLRPQDLGVLAGTGIPSVQVYRQPRVAILSTGDELVPAGQSPPPGKIRDINATTLTALVEEAGGVPRFLGICPDDFNAMRALCLGAMEDADMLLLSGGSSVGARDFTLRVFESLEGTQLLAHGVSIRPGKPTILVRQWNKALFGLPGHVASAMVIFTLFVRPLIRLYSGLGASMGLQTIPALTAEPIPSAIGFEEYIRVRLSWEKNASLPLAHPVYGKSGLLSPLVAAGGLFPIGRDVEGLDQGTQVEVLLFP